jgi:uncharacterized protein
MRNYTAKDVDGYIAGAAKEARPTLTEVRRVIRLAIPNAEEGISWGVPFYKYHGLLGGFAVFKHHVSFGLAFVLEKSARDALAKKGYTTGSKTIQIGFHQKVPTTALRRILKARATANKARERIR